MLALLVPLALAQSVSAVPPGARAVTVMVCDTPDGCTAAFNALADKYALLGLPLLDFDAVASAGPAGGDARAALDDAEGAALKSPDRAHLEAVRAAWRATPLTLPPAELFETWLTLGAARLAAGDTPGGDEALAAACSASAARVWDLPALPAAALDRYLAIAEATVDPGRVTVLIGGTPTDATRVFVDGQLAGPAPLTAAVPPGWHRISVERPGRRTAWVGEVQVASGRTATITAHVSADDAPDILEATVMGAIRGVAAPPDVAARLADWGRSQGLAEVRFVAMSEPRQSGPAPEERVVGRAGTWDLDAVWLDVSAERFDDSGPGPATLRAAAAPDRFSLGATVGYAYADGGVDAHDQLDIGLLALARLNPTLSIDARVDLWRAAQPWYLYEGVLTQDVATVAAGVRWAPGGGAAWVGGHALLVVPVAVGGQVVAGWAWHPSPRWRVGVEGRGGVTNRGPVAGAGVIVWLSG